ncbi:HNH endonuclease signature motif containing protein [Bacillus sp. M5A3_1b]
MSRKRKNISGYDIMRYWLDKEDGEGIPYIEIDGVQCFRCRKNSEMTCNDINDDVELKDYWDKKTNGFVKAHIVPYAVGGACHPSNMIFLCEHCNRDDLDVKSKDLYMNWLNRERKKHIYGTNMELIERMAQCLIKYGVNEEKLSFMFGEESDDFKKFVSENCACNASISKKTYYDTVLALALMYKDELDMKEQMMKDYS